ncbi:hypothetical protein THOE12_90021 [Vibrio rotiferianus]|nr:hypothetical protein THOE12_90021 [Vibrio rotiferianus]
MHSTYKQLFLGVKLMELISDLAQIQVEDEKYKHFKFKNLDKTSKTINFF